MGLIKKCKLFCCVNRADRYIVPADNTSTTEVEKEIIYFKVPREKFSYFCAFKPEEENVSVGDVMHLFSYAVEKPVGLAGKEYKAATFKYQTKDKLIVFEGLVPGNDSEDRASYKNLVENEDSPRSSKGTVKKITNIKVSQTDKVTLPYHERHRDLRRTNICGKTSLLPDKEISTNRDVETASTSQVKLEPKESTAHKTRQEAEDKFHPQSSRTLKRNPLFVSNRRPDVPNAGPSPIQDRGRTRTFYFVTIKYTSTDTR